MTVPAGIPVPLTASPANSPVELVTVTVASPEVVLELSATTVGSPRPVTV